MSDRITGPFERPQTASEQLFGLLDYVPVTRGALRRQMDLVWDYLMAQTKASTTALEALEARMTSTEDAAYSRLAELAGLVKAEFASLKSQVDAAIADKDAAIEAGVASALGEDSAADATRLESLIAEFEQVLPVPVPDIPVPAPGEAAELPEADEVEDPEPADVDFVSQDSVSPADDSQQ